MWEFGSQLYVYTNWSHFTVWWLMLQSQLTYEQLGMDIYHQLLNLFDEILDIFSGSAILISYLHIIY